MNPKLGPGGFRNKLFRIYFKTGADFIFSAKVNANFTKAYDGGAIFIYDDSKNWGKLLFERFKSGKNGIASTVTRSKGDDAYHITHDNNEMTMGSIDN